MGGYDPTPTDVTVDAVPIVVTSMTRAGKRAAVAGTLALAAVTIAILLGAGPALAQQNPTAPHNLRSEVSDAGHIMLNWEAPSEDAESVTGYEILRRRPLQNERTLLSYVADTGSTATTYTDTAVEPGEKYVYRVVALRGQARSVRSNFTRLTVPQWNADDLAPSRLVAKVGGDVVQLSWQAPAVNGGSVTGYRVLRAQDDAPLTILVSDSGSTATSYADRGAMTPGASYSYQVMALRGSQASQGSNISVVSIPEQAQVAPTTRADADATAPSNLAAVLSGAKIRLSWDAPTEDDSTVTGYQILRRHAGLPFSLLKADTGDTNLTYVDDSAARLGMTYDYQVKALRSADLSASSNVASVTRSASCTDADFNTSPVDVPVTATPIVVSSTASDYFVLFVRPDLESDVEVPVSVIRGEAGTTTLTEELPALPIAHYRVEKYPIDDPGDVDGDCTHDLDELADVGAKNPLNRAAEIVIYHGSAAIPDRATFERLAYQGEDVLIDLHLIDLQYVKFFLFNMHTDRPGVYFMNTVNHRWHGQFAHHVPFPAGGRMRGEIIFHPNVIAPDGSLGVYRFAFQPLDAYSFQSVQYAYEVLAASMPLLTNNLMYYPMPLAALPLYLVEQSLYDNSRVNILLERDIYPDVDFISLNPGVGYGYLRLMSTDDRPNPRDIVIYESLPNDLPRVAGIITTIPQTPLSHVNLRATQDQAPNAFLRDALEDETITSLIDSHVSYTVTRDGYTIAAATKAEVDAHYESLRPETTQTPERDLSVTEITALEDIGFDDWTAFGVKAANVAVLGTLGFPAGTVPDGFAVPFYFYDEFMKANDLDAEVTAMLADTDFQDDYDTQEEMLKDLRDAIGEATTPDWIITALEEMHAEFPEGTSLRYRSSTNNEDLPGFSGAGLYDSKTQDPDETEDDGIDKSIKDVWASLWNFRAFVERDFHRIDHTQTAMGVLVHPNYSDELANGVAVSYDPIQELEDRYYVNTQVGEDLVTNPEALSVPEELMLLSGGSYEVLIYSNQVDADELLMSDAQLTQLRSHLETIHDSFKLLYDPDEDERFAMEIEFKITSDDILAIKQARPWVFRPTNKPPKFLETETGTRAVTENAPVGRLLGAPVEATDEEGDELTYSMSGDDAGWFRLDSETGQLRLRRSPDYETASQLHVVIKVADPFNLYGDRIELTVTVRNQDEWGTLELSSLQGRVGTALTATLSDPDGGISVTSWEWQRSRNRNTWSTIYGATGNRYTPTTADIDHYLRVSVNYYDNAPGHHGIGTATRHPTKDRPSNNHAPTFDHPTYERSVAENASAGTFVGAALIARDADNDILSYSLGANDHFAIDPATGQIEVAAGATLDHESQPLLSVLVKARDPSNAVASAVVNISVTDVNEAPRFAMPSAERSIAAESEAGASVGAPLVATDEDGDSLSYSLRNSDGLFGIEQATGQIFVAIDGAFDGAAQVRYTMTVVASDPLGLSAEVEVSVLVPRSTVITGPDDDGQNASSGGSGGGGFAGFGGGPPPGPSPSEADFEWTVDRDIEELDSGHEKPSGSWSDGVTLWLLDNPDGPGDAVYAYDLATGERVEDREFDLDDTNRAPRGVWSDHTTIWVSDSGQDKLFAHDIVTGERTPERDIELDRRNADPRGIWSDGETVWVLDGRRDALFAYDLSSGELLGEYELAEANSDPRGIWSDGVTVWVSDHGAKRIFAYRLPVPGDKPPEDAIELERVTGEDFAEPGRVGNNSPRGLWSDGDVMYVADANDSKVYSYNMPDAIDARLASLTLEGVDFGEFSPLLREYEGVADAGVTETTVVAEAAQDSADVVIEPPDADEAADGHQVALVGLDEIAVTVTSADGSRERVYRVLLGEEAAGPSPSCLRGAVGVGFSLAVSEGGSVEDLVACARGRHVTALYALHEGEYVPYILGAPDFVNDPFRALFADGVPALLPLVVRSEGPATPAPPAPVVTEPFATCLLGEIADDFSLVVSEGGSVADLVACAEGLGVTAVYALVEGEWVSYILGAPEFVNARFRGLFPDSVPVATPLTVRGEGP